MSQVVLEMASAFQTDTILDLGSGKAYLSQVVAAQSTNQNLKLLAVDSSSTNSSSASKRSQKLEVLFSRRYRLLLPHFCVLNELKIVLCYQTQLNRDKIESDLSVDGIQGHQEKAIIKSFGMSPLLM